MQLLNPIGKLQYTQKLVLVCAQCEVIMRSSMSFKKEEKTFQKEKEEKPLFLCCLSHDAFCDYVIAYLKHKAALLTSLVMLLQAGTGQCCQTFVNHFKYPCPLQLLWNS